jgi:hypothetical protein
MRIFTVRNNTFPWSASASKAVQAPAEENTWQFGQVISLVLLILPFFGFFGKCTFEFLLYCLRTDVKIDAFASPPDRDTLIMKAPPGNQDYTCTLHHQGVPTNLASTVLQSDTSRLCTSEIRTGIQEEPWYKKLLACWYLLSCTVLIFTIWLFTKGDLQNLLGADIVVYYVMFIFVDLSVLWIATLIFIDHDVQAAWKRHSIGRLTSRKIVSYVCWGLTFIIIASLSLSFLSLGVLPVLHRYQERVM